MISNNSPINDQMTKLWRASQERLARAKAGSLHTRYLDLTQSPIEIEAFKLLPEERARELQALVIERKGYVVALAVVDPHRPGIDKLQLEFKNQGFAIRLFEVSKEGFEYGLTLYKKIPKDMGSITDKVEVSAAQVAALEKELTTLEKVAEALKPHFVGVPQVGEVLNIVLAGAMTNRASDIHYETKEGGSARLRYRIDGVLQTVGDEMPYEFYKLLLLRIKLLCNLRLNVSTVAQDGSFAIQLGALEIELRVAISPSEFGEAIVMRILDPRAIQLSLSDLGLRADDLEILTKALRAPNGMILNTGPTGSGKTTTLYACLRSMVTPDIKVITIEDPIEYHLAGVEQTQVNDKAGYTFANGLRSMMRQDPDVILVGEIRDKETAEIGLQAALTGHLVFSTLHTNSSAGVIPRLLDLGAQSVSIGPALNLVIAQRLVRKLCLSCRKKKVLEGPQKEQLKKFLTKLPARVDRTPYEKIEFIYEAAPGGCESCHKTGYKGRLGVYEMLTLDNSYESLIAAHTGEAEIEKKSRENGLVPLQDDGLLKILSGITSFEELESVTGPIQWE